MLQFETGRKVIVRPNPNIRPVIKYERITERDSLGNDISEPEKELTRAPGTKFTLMASPSAKLNGYLATGLHHMVANPFKELKAYKSSAWADILKDKEEVLLSHVIEYKFNKPINYYSNEVDLQRVTPVVLAKDLPQTFNFWQSDLAMFDLEDAGMVLNLDRERDLILYYLLKEDPLCANSYEELTPFTKYFIAAEHEEESRKANKDKSVDICLGRLVEIDNEDDGKTLKGFGNVLGVKTKGLRKDRIYQELSSRIKQNKQDFITNFNYYYKLWKEPATKAEFNTRSKLVDYLDYGVISLRGTEYSWLPPVDVDGKRDPEVTWYRRDEVIEFLMDKKFQKERALMEAQFEAKAKY